MYYTIKKYFTRYPNEYESIRSSFMVDDVFDILKNIGLVHTRVVVVEMICVSDPFRRQGYGTMMMDEIKNMHGNSEESVIIAKVMTGKWIDLPDYTIVEGGYGSSEEWDNSRYSVCSFIESCGFRNVNDYIGLYENSKTYLYTENDVGYKVYEELIK